MMNDLITPTGLTLYLDGHVFQRDGILKCCYWYTRLYLVDIQVKGSNFVLSIHPQPTERLADPDQLYTKLKKDLLDFQLRDTITKETQNIRDLLIAKAFANGALDEPFTDDLSDPVLKR